MIDVTRVTVVSFEVDGRAHHELASNHNTMCVIIIGARELTKW